MYSILEVYFLTSPLIFFIYGIIFSLSFNLKFPRLDSSLQYFFYLILLNGLFLNLNVSFVEYSLFNNTLVKTGESNILFSIIIVFSFFTVFVTSNYNKSISISSFEFFFLILLSVLNSSLLLSVNHLFLFFLLLEFQSMLLFIFASINRRSRYGIEGALKYFILGSFSSILLLLGIALVYISTSFMFFDDFISFSFIIKEIDSFFFRSSFQLGVLFISIGMLFKLYSAPFHFWVADIYQGSSFGSVLFFSITSFVIFFFLFIKIFFSIFYEVLYSLGFYEWLRFFSILSILFGCLGGLSQKKLKRIIAYSSITSTGYIILILSSYNTFSIVSSFLFIYSYIIALIGIFAILSELLLSNNSYIENYSQLKNFFLVNKTSSFMLSCFFFSLGGLPPFLGFLAKFELLYSLIFSNSYYLFFFFMFFSTISFFYYVRVVKYSYSKDPYSWNFSKNPSYSSGLILVICFFLISLGLFWNSSFLLFSKVVTVNIILS